MALPLQRTPEQERARIERAKELRQAGNLRAPARGTLPTPANNNSPRAANDNEERGQKQAEERVNRIRFAQAQVILASEEEAYNQIEKEEKGKPAIIRYMPAGAVAVFKDFGLDLAIIGTLPVIGTIISFICAVLIFIFVILAKKNSSVADMGFIIKRLLIVLVSFVIEGFAFGINFFPFEVATVAIIYFMDRHLSEKQITVLKDITRGLRKRSL